MRTVTIILTRNRFDAAVRAPTTPLIYASGQLEVELAQRELRVGGIPVPIGGRAFEIIEVLVQTTGALVTKDDLMERVWPGAIVEENTLQVHISAVRKALGPNRGMLKTLKGRGYRLLGTWNISPGRHRPTRSKPAQSRDRPLRSSRTTCRFPGPT